MKTNVRVWEPVLSKQYMERVIHALTTLFQTSTLMIVLNQTVSQITLFYGMEDAINVMIGKIHHGTKQNVSINIIDLFQLY